jgi:hypothetical protein
MKTENFYSRYILSHISAIEFGMNLMTSILKKQIPLIMNGKFPRLPKKQIKKFTISQEKRKTIPQKKRREVYKKYKNKCFYCGEKTFLEIHHKNMNYNDNRLSNLVLVCPTHHRHRHYIG